MDRDRSLPGVISAAFAKPPAHTAGSSPAIGAAVYTHTVHHGGNRYFATAEMAEIFRSRATEIARRGDTELVPLLHRSGVDLLIVCPLAHFAVVAIEVGHLDGG